MAEGNTQEALSLRLERLESKLAEGASPTRKDAWDKFTTLTQFVSSVVLAALVALFTINYQRAEQERLSQAQKADEQLRKRQSDLLEEQNRLRNMEAVARFLPHLSGNNATTESQRLAVIAIDHFGDTKLATRFAELTGTKGALQGLVVLAQKPALSAEERQGIEKAIDRLRASEPVAQEYRASPSRADVGVWNLNRFAVGTRVLERPVEEINKRAEILASLLGRLHPDVMGLSEVNGTAMRVLSEALAKRGLQFDYVLLDTGPMPAFHQAVLANRTNSLIVDRTAELRKEFASLLERRAFPRLPGFVDVRISVPGSELSFLFILVHLKSPVGGGREKTAQRRRAAAEGIVRLVKALRQRGETRILVGGTFHADLDAPELEPLMSFANLSPLDSATSQSGVSYVAPPGASWGNLVIDHIFITPELKIDRSGFAWPDAPAVRLDKEIDDYRERVSDALPLIAAIAFPRTRVSAATGERRRPH